MRLRDGSLPVSQRWGRAQDKTVQTSDLQYLFLSLGPLLAADNPGALRWTYKLVLFKAQLGEPFLETLIFSWWTFRFFVFGLGVGEGGVQGDREGGSVWLLKSRERGGWVSQEGGGGERAGGCPGCTLRWAKSRDPNRESLAI